ncbi:L,D-transpeptidase family protein [Rhodovibrionaceae bacterium A322]
MKEKAGRRVAIVSGVAALLTISTALGLWLLERRSPEGQGDLTEARNPGAGRPQALVEGPLDGADFARQRPLFLRLFKQESLLEMWVQEDGRWTLLKEFEICRWAGKLGPKEREGDHQSPEGFYLVGEKQLNPNSSYHLSFNLGFPNVVERAQGRTGSYLMIHGGCQSAGCYAMTDEGVEEIYRMVEAALAGGQQAVPVHVFPFRLTNAALAAFAQDSRWSFWKSLQPGYQAFERSGNPPMIYGCGQSYAVQPGDGCKALASW